MRILISLTLTMLITGCQEKSGGSLTAQEIVDKSIAISGGALYETCSFTFDFRDKTYVLEKSNNRNVLKRITRSDTAIVTDVKSSDGFQRYINDSLISLPDSMAQKYSNSVNSVHYFAYLPYGLNDAAVNKKLLGEVQIKNSEYYKVQITFDQQGGGKDYDDVYIYWFNKESFKPDYLAYEFHVDGGGLRFREAYNERYVTGIRFVDYNNYKPRAEVSIFAMDSLFTRGHLDLFSKIELTDIVVNPDSYN
ncbi:MAG TPA: DUF6503 family protein, partial [Eudoraea sp.]|nr:DUF6503 family protein [Eudoraea sp.]